jgi:cyclopropane-fatty-acyl-phospholipid synthase
MGPLRFLLQRVIRKGTLHVIDWQGRVYQFGDGSGQPVVMRLHNKLVAWQIFLNPEMAAGEAYMDGTLSVESGDILDFLDIFIGNFRWHPDNMLRKQQGNRRAWLKKLRQWNPLTRARRNVAHHYDLSADLYRLFLDEDWQYSCAYFRTPEASLEQAQRDKKLHIAAKLRLDNPALRVLEIGSGWGGLALTLHALAGVDVTGITLSVEQLKHATARAQAAGVESQVRFALQDYREVQSKFDRIVSVGMFEHVGVPHYQEFFDKACTLLSDDGVMLLHTIGRAAGPSSTDPWTEKYIFPGGYMPALSEITPAIERAGLYITDIEVLRGHYAATIEHWYARTKAARAEMTALYDARFWRMWMFYLGIALCGFRHAGIVVFQIQLSRTQEAVPLLRDYMVDDERKLLKKPLWYSAVHAERALG